MSNTPSETDTTTIADIEAEIQQLKQQPLPGLEQPKALATAYLKLGKQYWEIKTPTALQQAVAAYEQAIQYGEQLSLEDEDNCKTLSNIYNAYGSLLCDDIRTQVALQKAIESFNKGIFLREKLFLDNSEKHNASLALGYFNRGNAQKSLGTADDLHQAIASYNQAIALRKELPLEVNKYRNDLAMDYMNRGNAQQALGTIDDLHQAIASYNQAIALRKELPLEVNEYRHDLAMAYNNRGAAQSALGTADDLHQAIASYNQAIALRKELPLEVNQYRNDLASAYMNRGTAQKNLGTADDLHQAIASYNQAIALFKEQPLEVNEYRQDLASAYVGMGNAQQSLGTADDLHQAIASYNQAIALRKELPLEVNQYRNDLAMAYMDIGTAQKNLGTADDLYQAIASYNQAIALGEKLPLEVNEYRNDLAGAYMNRGTAQKALGTDDDLNQAIESYDEAITISEPLDQHVWQYAETRAKVFANKAIACFNLREWEEANEAAEAGLELLSDLEISGVYVLRSLREQLFNLTIATYLNDVYNFLPEFLLAHLDPQNVGAAPQSEAMHEAALRGLQRLYLIAAQQHAELIPEIRQTLERLAEIRASYFLGTAEGAKLSALYYEDNEHNRQRAEQLLTEYTQHCPSDAEGHINLAAFYLRQTNPDMAVQRYETAAATIAAYMPNNAGTDIQQHTIDAIVQSLALAANVKAALIFTQLAANDAIRRQTLNQYDDLLVEWLNDFPAAHLPATLQAAVKQQLKHLVKPKLQAQRETWLKQQDKAQLQQWQQHAHAQQHQQHQITVKVIRSLPFKAARLLESLEELLQQLNQQFQTLASVSDEADKAQREEALNETLARQLSALFDKLHQEELTDALNQLAQQLGSIWPALDIEDRKTLASAVYCMGLDNFQGLAGFRFGQAIERNFFKHWFNPVREASQQQGHSFTVQNEADHLEPKLVQFLNHEPKGKLALGSFVDTLRRLVHAGKPPTCPAEAALLHYLSTRPQATLLLGQPPKVCKYRQKALDKITAIRNKCVHGEEPERKEIAKMFEDVVSHPEHAFFRYFVGALVSV